MPAEDLWAPARARRTLLMALDMLVIPAGVVLVVAALDPPWRFPPALWRSELLLLGAVLTVLGVASLRALVLAGRKVGAVYGVKAARRAGLLPPEPPSRPTERSSEGRP
ncbi:MAG: hypothetical protein KGJ23_04355 [Euryarchaeota archaeon]|nr:hypothetical protein [Euryarchaeota archaeon]MDE1835832.1 hypothetical protein [Euryarchaeota archaeon]MDE1880517.1 hypothetical protein [Euryarchaeota archaeon]MDE2045806.1 hypothetical protein [Thermoplasmata archaeon]